MDCNLSGSSVHGIFQAIVLEWIAISFSSESSQPRDLTCVSSASCIAGRFLATKSEGKLKEVWNLLINLIWFKTWSWSSLIRCEWDSGSSLCSIYHCIPAYFPPFLPHGLLCFSKSLFCYYFQTHLRLINHLPSNPKEEKFKIKLKKKSFLVCPSVNTRKITMLQSTPKKKIQVFSQWFDLYFSLKSSLAAKTHYLPPCWAFTSSPLLFCRTAIRVYKRETKLAPLLLPQGYLAVLIPCCFQLYDQVFPDTTHLTEAGELTNFS